MNEINDLLSKKAEMSLLFAQSLEIQTLYHQPIPNDTFPISNYYLLPKKWLDEYKNSYNYNLIKPKYEEYSDYNTFKQKVLRENPYKNSNSINSNNDEFPPLQNNCNQFNKYQINFPVNFFPVKEEIFNKSPIDKKEFLYEVIIGENNIFIIDNKSRKNIFVCSIETESEELDEFTVNVNYIIIYKNENIFKKEMKNHISQNKGIEKYCKKRNININNNEEQEIINNEMEKIGIFIVLNNNIHEGETPTEFLMEYLQMEDNKNNTNFEYGSSNINSNNSNAYINNNIDNFNNINNNSNNINNNNNININNNNSNNNLDIDSSKLDFKKLSFGIYENQQKNENMINQNNNINNNNMNLNNRFYLDNNNIIPNRNIQNNIQNNNPNERIVNNQDYQQNNAGLRKKGKKIILSFTGDIYYNIRRTHIRISYIDSNTLNNNNNCNNIPQNGPNNVNFKNFQGNLPNNMNNFGNNNMGNNPNNYNMNQNNNNNMGNNGNNLNNINQNIFNNNIGNNPNNYNMNRNNFNNNMGNNGNNFNNMNQINFINNMGNNRNMNFNNNNNNNFRANNAQNQYTQKMINNNFRFNNNQNNPNNQNNINNNMNNSGRYQDQDNNIQNQGNNN